MNQEKIVKINDQIEELWQKSEILTGTLEVIYDAAKEQIVDADSYKNAILGTANMACELTCGLHEIMRELNE